MMMMMMMMMMMIRMKPHIMGILLNNNDILFMFIVFVISQGTLLDVLKPSVRYAIWREF